MAEMIQDREYVDEGDFYEGYLQMVEHAALGTFEVGEPIPCGYNNLHWSSDWNGDEVGYDHLNVVGLYSIPNAGIDMYLDSETGTILEMWEVGEDE